MTLPFSTELNGKPTQFVEKIWQGLMKYENLGIEPGQIGKFAPGRMDMIRLVFFSSPPKLHTIRRDEKDRWKEGRDIHMVINNRTPKRLQFAPVVKCVSTQRIEIKEVPPTRPSTSIKVDDAYYAIVIDGNYLQRHRIEKLALNDGFESVADFFNYFKEDFTGKIIHWTKLKY